MFAWGIATGKAGDQPSVQEVRAEKQVFSCVLYAIMLCSSRTRSIHSCLVVVMRSFVPYVYCCWALARLF